MTTRIAEYPDLLDMMAETGCQSLFIGLELINDESLQGVCKDNRFDRYEKLVRRIHSRGIMINASKVFGLDGDGPDVFRRTLDWLVAHKFETLTSHILTPYPETELYRRMYAGTYGSIGSFTHSKIYCAVCRSIRRRGIRIRYST